MGRLKLLIGDEDKLYIENLAGYIMEKFPYTFQINCFTDIESYRRYFMVNKSNTDIILASSKFIDAIGMQDNKQNQDNKQDLEKGNRQDFETGTVVVQIVEKKKTNERNSVYKYTNGYSLVKKIISIYEKSMQADIPKKQTATKVIAVYSPAGGTGKTTIAVKLAQCLSREGSRIFYLNVESFNTQSCFSKKGDETDSLSIYMHSLSDHMHSEKQGDFSKLLFALKQKDEDLILKVKEAIHYDYSGNIGYFSPPDSFLEFDELDSSELKLLLEELIQSGLFDIILLDLSSSYNYKTLSLIEESHEVIMVTTPERIAVTKLIGFLNDIGLHQKKRGINFLDKIFLVMNRWQENAMESRHLETLNRNLSIIGKSFEIFLPESKTDLLLDYDHNNMNIAADFNRELFDRELYKIAYRYRYS
ncbi:MAG TPA: AAA family ATPase [Clostridiaceae bacterium]|nr:AAA family ATPase [Clostridiaceae bacterium]